MYWFTADQHFGHENMILYADRPFKTVDEMDAEIIRRHNEVVKPGDTVVHVGDFALTSKAKGPVALRGYLAKEYLSKMEGHHIFIKGSHDKWMVKDTPMIREFNFGRGTDMRKVVACHYAMRTWPIRHYGSYHVYGHSHGRMPSIGRSVDVGVDCHNFYPVSYEKLQEIMEPIEYEIGD